MQALLLCWRSDSLASARDMTDNNRQQAMIPEGSTLIPNPVGTAPGFIVETDDGVIIAVPGVPREMMRLMQDTVLPYLRARSGYEGVIRRRVLRTVGIGESALDDMLGPLMLQGNPTVGLAAKTAQVDIRIAARSDSADSAEAMIEEIAQEVRVQAGAFIYSETAGEDLETVVVDLLAARGATFAVLETNTSGRLAQRIRKQDGGRAVMPGAFAVEGEDLPWPGFVGADDRAPALTEETALAAANRARERRRRYIWFGGAGQQRSGWRDIRYGRRPNLDRVDGGWRGGNA